MKKSASQNNPIYLETELGILTRQGSWFHTNRQQIEEFVPGLLDEVSLDELIKDAMAWVQSSDSLALILLYILLFMINPWLAAVIVLAFHWFWNRQKSGFVMYGLGNVLRVFNSDIFLFLLGFVCLTLLGYRSAYAAVGVGIVCFFLMKTGLLRRGWARIDQTAADELTLNDRVLKMVIIKHAWHQNLTPDNIEQMEDRIRELAFNRKKGKR